MAEELERVGEVVGRQGKTRQRARFGGQGGAWVEMEASVNTLVDDLLRPTTEVTRAIAAVAQGRVSLVAEVAVVPPGPTIGIGIGGFGGGYRSGGGFGFGMSAPIGGAGPADTGYGASASLSDTRSGQLMWSGRASAAPSGDAGAQLGLLATRLLEAARQSGLFPTAP